MFSMTGTLSVSWRGLTRVVVYRATLMRLRTPKGAPRRWEVITRKGDDILELTVDRRALPGSHNVYQGTVLLIEERFLGVFRPVYRLEEI